MRESEPGKQNISDQRPTVATPMLFGNISKDNSIVGEEEIKTVPVLTQNAAIRIEQEGI